MPPIPRDSAPDSTLALLLDGYEFISKRCQRHQSDIFATRLMGREAICIVGEEAASVFYARDRFTRRKAMPRTTLKLLQDEGSVQVLDGDAHRHRKQLFMSLMTPAEIQRLVDLVADEWQAQIEPWARSERVVLHSAVQRILCRAVCAWAGVPLREGEVAQRTREFGAMVEGAGAIGPRNWFGMLLRARTEHWVQGIVEDVRAGRLDVPAGSAAHAIAWHRELDGSPLDTDVAAVELINMLRPVVAVARFVTFAALALHEHPASVGRLRESGEEYLGWFVQEVRRYYPFFPFIGGRVLDEFDWRDYHFTRGTWVLLDLYGTDHDARIWDEPYTFRPERFRDWNGSAFNFIPQGGGDHFGGHRCPGEWITIEVMKRAVRLLTTTMRYDVPPQDLRINLWRMPAIPKSRFVIANVRRA